MHYLPFTLPQTLRLVIAQISPKGRSAIKISLVYCF